MTQSITPLYAAHQSPRTVTPFGIEGWGTYQGGALGTSTSWPLAKLVLYFPIGLTRALTVARMGWFNGAIVDAAGHVQVGVYNASFSLIGSSASTTPSGTNGTQQVNVTNFVMPVGVQLYMAITCDSTTQSFGSVASVGTGQLGGMGVMEETTGAFGLPSTATPIVCAHEYPTPISASDSTTT